MPIYKDMYSIGSTCVNSQWCLDGGTVDNSQLSLPKLLKIKIYANPTYWGWEGAPEDFPLCSGYARYSQGYFDFYDGFQPDHIAHKVCGQTDVGYFRNEQRPDVQYRSVYDDETGYTHYNGTTPNDVMRGGAEVYLIDREALKTTDQSSCDESNPQEVFKKTPDNFGFGNKILFNDTIYKNLTGGWRLSTCDNCYATGVTNDIRNECCSGSGNSGVSPKQHIIYDDHFGESYDPSQYRCLSDKYTSEQACQPDGTTPKEYQGTLVSLSRDSGVSDFIQAEISYFGGAASGLREGQQLLIYDSGKQYYNSYHIFDISHSSNTTLKLSNTFGSGQLSYTGASGDKWIALGTIDPESCCGGAAYGVDNTTKLPSRQPVYHVDIPKIFNNAKNKIFSNRSKYQAGSPRVARNYVAASGSGSSGIPLLSEGEAVYPRTLPYFGPYYRVDNQDTSLRFFNDGNTIVHKNHTCYTKSQTLSIFPDCLTQAYRYKDCDQVEKYYQINVPRLAFVYRPCNYNDPCSFSGNIPLMAGGSGMPSSLEDLKRGFGGQEIVMYINMGDAWGKEILRSPCSCDGAPQGTSPPQVITIKSPVTYPCFPKFDLYPSGYGCQDPSWYVYAKNYLGIAETGTCGIAAYFDACWKKQPYTTYGFIRSLCGHETHSRKEVIQELAERRHTGGFTDINPTGGLISTEPLYKNFVVPSDQTGSGFPVGDCSSEITEESYASGGFTFDEGACLSGNKPYWGLTDTNGRLAYPYFYTKVNSVNLPCGAGTGYYVDFDNNAWFSGGFPTDNVPFLIEIDHEDNCVGCSTTQLEVKDHSITIESLPTKFYHGGGQITGNESYNNLSYKYGFNHCKYPGVAVTPSYDADNDTWKVNVCDASTFTNDATALEDLSSPFVGETCGCIGDGVTTTLYANPLIGTNIPKYWSTSGVRNSYVKFEGCDFGFSSDYLSCPGGTDGSKVSTVLSNYEIYFAAKMSCSTTDYSNSSAGFINDGANGLGDWINCGGCSHSYPATSSKPNISIDFYYVNKRWRALFERMSDLQLVKNSDFLNNGASKGTMFGGSRNGIIENPNCNLGGGQSGVSISNGRGGTTCWPLFNNTPNPRSLGSPTCGQATVNEKAATFNGTAGADCAFFLENDLNYIKWNNNIPGCNGARIRIYGVNLKNNIDRTRSFFLDSLYGLISPIGSIGSGCGNECVRGVSIGDQSIYGPAEMFASNSGNLAYYDWLGTHLIFGCTNSCSEYIGSVSCLGNYCQAVDNAIGCKFDNSSSCCHPTDKQIDTGEIIFRPGEKFASQCWADSLSYTLLGEFYYYEFSASQQSEYGAGCSDGWYGWLNINHVHVTTDNEWTGIVAQGDNFLGGRPVNMLAWEGFNLPNIGDTQIMPFEEPIAFNYSQVQSCFDTSSSITYKSICAYDQSVNKTIQVDSEFVIPSRSSEWGSDVHLNPINCEVLAGPTGNKIEIGSTCIKPIPFNTFNNGSIVGGYGEIETGGSFKVDVIKPTCFPEIMTVHKVECSNGIYALHVSREYYEHDRKLYTVDAYVDSVTNLVVATRETLYGRINGGQTITKYSCGTGPNQYKIASICGGTGVGCSTDGTMDYFGLLPKMAETDGITPCFTNSCVTGVNPFQKSLCANYEVGSTLTGGIGRGGSGYFEVLPAYSGSPTGCLTFYITNPGSGYYSSLFNSGNQTVTVTGCALPYFDRPPCVSLSLHVYPNTSYDKRFDVGSQSLIANTGGVSGVPQYFVYSGEVNINSCGGYSEACAFDTGIYPITFGACDSNSVTLGCELSNKTCEDSTQYYPNLYNGGNGTGLWNFYNLFYDSGYLGGLALDDADPDDNVWFPDPRPDDRPPEPFPFNIRYDATPKHGRFSLQTKNTDQKPLAEIIPFSETGLKCLHSCIQDHTTCGGSFFCNKEFFPRRSYLSGTKVGKFAPWSLCVQNGQKGYGNWLQGHVSDDFINTFDESTLGENSQNGWLDPCKEGTTSSLTSNVGIDDHVIYVNDITPLLGAKHPYYKLINPSGLDSKSCVFPTSGCFDFLGVHNAQTMSFVGQRDFTTGDSGTYYEILQSGCLFEPFKIFVDVQCCQERLGHPGSEDPMYLSWIAQGVPAGACKGIIYDQTCDCYNGGAGNSCSINATNFGTTPYSLQLLNYWVATEVSCESGSCPHPNTVFFEQPTFDICCSYSSGVAVGTTYDGQLYVFYDGNGSYPYNLLDRINANKDNYLHCTTDYPKRVWGWDFCQYTADAILLGTTSTTLTLNGSSKVNQGSGIKNFGASGCYSNCNRYCSELLAEFGCECVTTAHECEYGSLLKLTVTE